MFTTKLTGFSYTFRFLTTKEKFHGFVDSEWQSLKGGTADENDKVEETSETFVEDPDAKKLKLEPEERRKMDKKDRKRFRGQNKSRPHIKPTTYDEKRLCTSMIHVRNMLHYVFFKFHKHCFLVVVSAIDSVLIFSNLAGK